MKIVRLFILFSGFVLFWYLFVKITQIPPYLLPDPFLVFKALFSQYRPLLNHTLTTSIEIISGLVIGTILGGSCALIMAISKVLKRWMLPVLVISQAIPVFALAPLLVLWFGYGMESKIVMATLIIFFPVTASFYDGMRRVLPEQLELAKIMDASPIELYRFILIPSALPAFGSGVRVAAAVAPIGAVVGEWVGASSGLGFYMLHANARMQIDRMFAALFLLSLLSLVLYFSLDWGLDKLIFWQKK